MHKYTHTYAHIHSHTNEIILWPITIITHIVRCTITLRYAAKHTKKTSLTSKQITMAGRQQTWNSRDMFFTKTLIILIIKI